MSAGPKRKSVRIVNLRPPVDTYAPIIFTAKKHARQGRDAQRFDTFAWIDRRINVHRQRLSRCNYETISPCHARRVQERIDGKAVRIRGRLLEPKRCETREFFRAGRPTINR